MNMLIKNQKIIKRVIAGLTERLRVIAGLTERLRVIAGLTRNPLIIQGMLKQVQHDVQIFILAILAIIARRHCGLVPQSPAKKGMLKQVQHGIQVFILAAVIGFGFSSCGDWLDVVPDGVATIDMAFNSRAQALKYLKTCYYYMPRNGGNPGIDPAIMGSDEYWIVPDALGIGLSYEGHQIAEGMQNPTSPILERWGSLYQAIRDCNTFLDNVSGVPDLPVWEREQWMAEVKVLKAYYHFCLVQMYGPVPLVRKNLPINVDVSTVKVEREPVDECFKYIVELLDEACKGDMLTPFIFNPAEDMGRITKPIALTLKAKTLVLAASPLYNGNSEQATLKNHDGTVLFNQTYDRGKWQSAMLACREAIEACHEAGIELYEYPNTGDRYTETIARDLTLRNAFNLRWNSELIWVNMQSIATASAGGMIFAAMPKLNPENATSGWIRKELGLPLKIATLFYTRNGVPLEEDKTRDINDIYNLRTADADHQLYIREGRTTVDLHFDREPRFYAWVGFDGGVWFGAGQYNDLNPTSLWYLALKIGETDGTDGKGTWTGYIPKKIVPFEGQARPNNTVSATTYAWPIMRLSDLYLLYAEAINEAEGPAGANSDEMFKYIDMVRDRAGLSGVKESWDLYTNYPKYSNIEGMREIIQQERLIELSMEGHRFWDIRRWKTAPDVYRTPLQGWFMQVSIIDGSESQVNQIMYTPQLLLEQKFSSRDYFWPIRSSDIDVNPNLVQNIGW